MTLFALSAVLGKRCTDDGGPATEKLFLLFYLLSADWDTFVVCLLQSSSADPAAQSSSPVTAGRYNQRNGCQYYERGENKGETKKRYPIVRDTGYFLLCCLPYLSKMIRSLGAKLLAAGCYAALLAASTPSASANVIGIDLGVDFMKVWEIDVG